MKGAHNEKEQWDKKLKKSQVGKKYFFFQFLDLTDLLQQGVLREAPPKKKPCKFGHCPKGGGVETLAQIVFGSSSVNINHY